MFALELRLLKIEENGVARVALVLELFMAPT